MRSCFQNGSLGSDEASFFGVLEVVAVAFGDLPINSLFDPCNLINQPVAIVLHHRNGEPVLGINNPNKEEAIGLQLVKRDVEDLLIRESAVGDGHTTGRIGAGELPWGVTGDHVEESASGSLLTV